MSCERYWRDGIVLVERGLGDPHRDGCEDCARAHASRQELIDALPLIGADVTGDPFWQAKVWQVIDGPARAPRRWQWQLAGALAAVSAIVLWIGLDRTRPRDVRPRVEVVETGPQRRSGAPHVGDQLHVFAGETADVWIYRNGRLVLQCGAHQVSGASAGCVRAPEHMVVDHVLKLPGEYRVIIILAPFALPSSRKLDDDLAALVSAGVRYVDERRSVY